MIRQELGNQNAARLNELVGLYSPVDLIVVREI
jgi:hypothetical protein